MYGGHHLACDHRYWLNSSPRFAPSSNCVNSNSVARLAPTRVLRCPMPCLRELWSDEDGQDIAEYAVMLGVILVIVVGTLRLIGGNANNVFSSVASNLQ